MRRQAGFTILELMIAITLVAAISAGMLTAMRNGLLTMGRTQHRIEANRRALGVQDLILRQIQGVAPVFSLCRGLEQAVSQPLFRGSARAMLLVTKESMTEGARGYPRVAMYRVQPNSDGSVRLEMIEAIYASPRSTLPFCAAALREPVLEGTATPVVLYPRLARAAFSFQQRHPVFQFGEQWLETWDLPQLPAAIRIEMQTVEATNMPVGTLLIPLHVSWTPGEYRDEF